jgi:hypothetical protein
MPASTLAQRVAAAVVLLPLALVASPTRASLVIGAVNTPVTQNFNSLTTTTSLPSLNTGGWRIWTFITPPSFADGATSPTLKLQTATMGITDLSGNYSFRDGAATTDRALGFIVGNVARHIMVEIENGTPSVLSTLNASWNLEKYRNGELTTTVSFFHSGDGVNWMSGGIGAVSYTPINLLGSSSPSVTSQAATLSGLTVASGAKYYLRWEVAPASGSGDAAAVGLDDFSISGATAVPEASSWLTVASAGTVSYGLARIKRRARNRRRPD